MVMKAKVATHVWITWIARGHVSIGRRVRRGRHIPVHVPGQIVEIELLGFIRAERARESDPRTGGGLLIKSKLFSTGNELISIARGLCRSNRYFSTLSSYRYTISFKFVKNRPRVLLHCNYAPPNLQK